MMRKPDIAARAAEPASLSKAEAERAVNVLLKAIRGALASGETVSLAGFGTLLTRSRAARQGRNPAAGERILIADRPSLNLLQFIRIDPGRDDFSDVHIAAKAHFPAFAVRAHSGDCGRMAERIGSSEPRKLSFSVVYSSRFGRNGYSFPTRV